MAASWDGIIAPVLADQIKFKNEIFIMPIGDDNQVNKEELKGKSIMVLGLPHKGGIVSLTLKNQYEQICARTVEYGSLEPEELGKSCEKTDPTKYEWVKREVSSIGGTDSLALNTAMRAHVGDGFFIKNGPFGSVGEVRRVTAGDPFQRLGVGGDAARGARAVGALASVMSASSIRLEACADNVRRTGWNTAVGKVQASSRTSVQAVQGGWENNQWRGHVLRFMTGPLRGESFPVTDNAASLLFISTNYPYSAPGRKELLPLPDDQFSLGPGYATGFCYTRKSDDTVELLWERCAVEPGAYSLYICGVNDAIGTTEFLEENNNAPLDVSVWNWKTRSYDVLCRGERYGKQDRFNAGRITRDHLSPRGDFKLALTAHDVVVENTEDKTGMTAVNLGVRRSGFAWFNYALLAPVPVVGRVNVNTAPPNLLQSLPGISAQVAGNLSRGIDSSGVPRLKPYRHLGDILNVKGMSLDSFERCANLLALDSSFYTVEVEAHTVRNRDAGNSADIPPALITGRSRSRFVLELDRTGQAYRHIVERERYAP